MAKKDHKKTPAASKSQVDKDNQQGVIEDLFNDYYKSRKKVYWMNLTRGLFFGVGSVLGGTVVVALVAWLLNLFTDIPGGFGDFIQYIVDLVRGTE